MEPAVTGEPLYDLNTKTWSKTCPCITQTQVDPECEWHGRLHPDDVRVYIYVAPEHLRDAERALTKAGIGWSEHSKRES